MSESRRQRRLLKKQNTLYSYSISTKPLTCKTCKRDIKTELCYANSNNTEYLCKKCYEEMLKPNTDA